MAAPLLPRQTFIVRFHEPEGTAVLEDVATGERVRLNDLALVGEELERRIALWNEAQSKQQRHRGRRRSS